MWNTLAVQPGAIQLPSDLAGVFAESNLYKTIVSAWWICEGNRRALLDLHRNDEEMVNVYLDTREAAAGLLEMARSYRLSRTDRLAALFHDGTTRELLVRTAGLLWALDEYLDGVIEDEGVPAEPAPGIDGGRCHVARRAGSFVHGHCGRFPRREDQVADQLSLFHPRLRITRMWVEDRRLTSVRMGKGLKDLFAKRCKAGELRIAVSGLAREVALKTATGGGPADDGQTRFRVSRIDDGEAQREALDVLLRRAAEEGISILVLPELRVPPMLVDRIVEFLRNQSWRDLQAGRGLLLVVAGSWHVPAPVDFPTKVADPWVNMAPVIDYRGEALWEHHKLAEYHILPENLTDDQRRAWGFGERGAVEQICRGESLQFLDSPAGRIAVAICAGFFQQELFPLLAASEADVFLVPAMTPDTRPLQTTASALVRSHHAATFVANCAKLGAVDKRCSFYQLPGAGAAPTVAEDPCWHVFP